MASAVREKDIKKLWEAGYLAKKISHRLPTAGQIIPTPEPHERVAFLPHFVRGLGLHKVGYNGGDIHIRTAKLALHAKQSSIRTRDEVFNLVSS